MKLIILILASAALAFMSGCYSTKSMGNTEKANKYLFVY
jgi:hypothetical protein